MGFSFYHNSKLIGCRYARSADKREKETQVQNVRASSVKHTINRLYEVKFIQIRISVTLTSNLFKV